MGEMKVRRKTERARAPAAPDKNPLSTVHFVQLRPLPQVRHDSAMLCLVDASRAIVEHLQRSRLRATGMVALKITPIGREQIMASMPPLHAAFGTFTPSRSVERTLMRTRNGGLTWASKRLTFVFRQWAMKRLKDRPVDTEVLGVRMRLRPQNNVCEKRILFTPQYFDARERSLIEPYLGDQCVFLDIGANVGGYALWAASKAGLGARIIAVEPDPVVFERLCFNIAINPTGNVKAVCTALADVAGPLTLFYEANNRGGASVRIAAKAVDGGERIEVHAITLTELIESERLDRVDVLKLDVEGSEDMILAPFLREASDAVLPKLIILNRLRRHWTDDLIALLLGRGYRVIEETAANSVLARGG
jgi:FkbM family methyltransferase